MITEKSFLDNKDSGFKDIRTILDVYPVVGTSNKDELHNKEFSNYAFGCLKSNNGDDCNEESLIRKMNVCVSSLAYKSWFSDGSPDKKPLILWRRKPVIEYDGDKIKISARFLIVAPSKRKD